MPGRDIAYIHTLTETKESKYANSRFIFFAIDPQVPLNSTSMILQRLPCFLLCSILVSLTCCSPSANDVVSEWRSKGWEIVEIHGTEGPVKRHGKLLSLKAQAVEASWIEKGMRKTKLYRQTNHHYLVLRFFKHDDDQFAAVMRKRK